MKGKRGEWHALIGPESLPKMLTQPKTGTSEKQPSRKWGHVTRSVQKAQTIICSNGNLPLVPPSGPVTTFYDQARELPSVPELYHLPSSRRIWPWCYLLPLRSLRTAHHNISFWDYGANTPDHVFDHYAPALRTSSHRLGVLDLSYPSWTR